MWWFDLVGDVDIDVVLVIGRVRRWSLRGAGHRQHAVVHTSVQHKVHLLILIRTLSTWTRTPPYLQSQHKNYKGGWEI